MGPSDSQSRIDANSPVAAVVVVGVARSLGVAAPVVPRRCSSSFDYSEVKAAAAGRGTFVHLRPLELADSGRFVAGVVGTCPLLSHDTRGPGERTCSVVVEDLNRSETAAFVAGNNQAAGHS